MQQQHPIDNMMQTTMESIRGMVDVNTVVGAPVMDQKGTTIIPISKVSFGFVAGGGEYAIEDNKQKPVPTDIFPFAGGTGAGGQDSGRSGEDSRAVGSIERSDRRKHCADGSSNRQHEGGSGSCFRAGSFRGSRHGAGGRHKGGERAEGHDNERHAGGAVGHGCPHGEGRRRVGGQQCGRV